MPSFIFRSMVKEEKRPPIQWGNRYSYGEIKAMYERCLTINNDREKHARELRRDDISGSRSVALIGETVINDQAI